jgi:hypothetical protein
MAATSTPYGFQPISDQVGVAPRPVRMYQGIASGYATSIYKYAPVTLNASTGFIQATTATTDKIFGIFEGVEYTPLGGRPVVSNFWPGGTTIDTNYDFFVYFWAAWNPSLRLRVQANGPVAQAVMGAQFNVVNPTTGNSMTGLSAAGVNATAIAASSQGQFFFTEFFDTTGIYDAPGDAFQDLIVGVAYPQVGLGFQTSIG